ncbi:MAG: lytic murein transglycosylase [Acidobacteria bacterium]|nr:lytic murein transglycosylase [Acidobacteriota bacterium]
MHSRIAHHPSPPLPIIQLALLVVVFLFTTGLQSPVPDEPPPFDEWLQELLVEARARGFSEGLIQEALANVEPRPQVIANDRSQAELVVGFDRYYQTRVTPQMVRLGRDRALEHRAVLAEIEAAYGVSRRVIVAIWGIETRYGRITGNTPVFQALATLAWEPRRAAFFRGELFNALTMVARGDIDTTTMTGSWAGAMGQAQFMPSSYLKFAQDFDRDGRRDIWGSTPDALASIANYLKGWGWDDEFRWGREVRVNAAARVRIEQDTSKPSEGCFAMRNMTERLPLTEWQRMGVRQADGAALPVSDVPASLVDTDARSFLVYPNYDAILRYNCAHYYALTVALLSDQIR